MIEKMFAISVESFLPNGKHRVILETCTAALFRHHNQVLADCSPSNKVSSALIMAARSAKISDPRFPGLSPEMTLSAWSKMIDEDCQKEDRISALAAMDPSGHNIHAILASIAADVRSMKNKSEALILENASHQSVISQLQNQVAVLKGGLTSAQSKLSWIKTPTGTPIKRKRRHEEDTHPIFTIADENCSDSMDVDDALDDPVQNAMNVVVEVPTVASRDPHLYYSNKSRAIAEGTGDNGKRLMSLFVTLSVDGGINEDSFGQSTIPKDAKNKQLFKNCLELAEFAGNKSDISILANKNKKNSVVDVQNAAVALEKACVEKLFEFEGTTAEADKRNKKPKRPFVVAMGTRIRDYKNRIHQVNQVGKAANAILMEIADLEKLESFKNPGTPPGQRSIRTFLGAKKG